MVRIRFGVIGCGGMGRSHIRYLVRMPGVKVTAACDIREERATAAASEVGGKHFVDHRDMLDSGLVDAVIIATPHFAHPPIGVDAFERGVHVICEKPLGVVLTPVDRMIAAAAKSGCRFAVVFQNRTVPLYQKARELIQSGRLGEIFRVYYMAPSYRTQAYYESDAWRGTWAEEGGGVLVNQAPHMTDMLWWLAGNPSEIIGRIATRTHQIEVEDEADALLKYPNGATGYYAVATGEAPDFEFIRIVGDRGTLQLGDRKLQFARLPVPLRKFTLTCEKKWASPEVKWMEIPVRKGPENGHREITRNFIRAICNPRVRLVSPGPEGIHQVEISCAIYLSAFTGRPVRLPVNRAEFDRLMSRLRRASRRVTEIRSVADSGVKFPKRGKVHLGSA